MACLGRVFSILLVVILAVSILIIVESASAQTIPKPSVPEFSLRYEDHSYYEQPTYTTDPITGKQVIENEAGYIKNDSIQINIKNQPFTSSKDASGNYTLLYYNVRYKGHFENHWQTYPYSPSSGYWKATQTGYTSIPLPNTQVGYFATDSQFDFQVQALVGYETSTTGISQLPPHNLSTSYQFHGLEGDWSPTQTITISDESASPSPTVPEFPCLLVISLLLSALAVALAFRIKSLNQRICAKYAPKFGMRY